MNVSQWFNNGLFGEPAIMLGLIAFIGLSLQKHPVQKLLSGTIKTMIGFKLMQIGANETGSSLSNLSAVIQNSFQIIGIIPHNETIAAMTQINYGKEMAVILLIGMIVHLVIARFTPVKYIFLSGHHMLFMAALLAGLLVSGSMETWETMLFGGIILAGSMSAAPMLSQRYVRKVIGGDQFAIGHFNSVGYLVAGFVGSLLKTKKPQEKPLKKTKLTVLFQDHMVVIFCFTFILFVIASIFSPAGSIENMFAGRHFIIVSVIQATWFAGGCFIVLAGVRMMLSEIVPAFKGIADRIVPGAIPALDCPVLYSYAPVAAVTGFLLSFAGGFAAMMMMMQLQYTVIIPGIIPNFFLAELLELLLIRWVEKEG